MLSHTRIWASHMNIRIWDVPYAYGPIYAYGAEQRDHVTRLVLYKLRKVNIGVQILTSALQSTYKYVALLAMVSFH